MAFLFISHHLQEVYDLCTAVTVYRDARHVLTAPVADLTKNRTGHGDDGREGQTDPAVLARGR
ncbi:hypothetical protein GCM10018966_041720 [Streptomyces yanii]